ncbi:Glucoamylase (glucan-1,4-alpha-glucosidase), GH15 family [Robiginitalea myxolifaciens]|uniref:Glucoamylase (Glucan-1,4-alpha-glucosidase), GH15 family n=1 Tax=Robiginitalea myxolifaciens TaxID=400055 RepID=A0A1I6FMT0_9FLAO|nr:glycoside hydrolase family 15 protein [Robiginitalea myxolifaciens]SFR31246.1 Glucoamylase (glucan-1,4-alpha-glucosidase), GH15 family [Robiginitalea myxolifaciens]
MDNLNYGIIGNCRSAALISQSGSLDWCCLPEFDSPSIFAKLLDEKKGGSFEFLVDESYRITQRYKKNTALLITRFDNGEDIFEVRDFMPRYLRENGNHYSPPEIIRYVRLIKGNPEFSVKFDPKLEYAKGKTETYVKHAFVVSLNRGKRFDTVFLYTSFNKNAVADGRKIQLKKDGYFLLSYNEKLFRPNVRKTYLEMERTKVYWLNWSNQTPDYRRYDKQIKRSAITLKLLSYDRSGAILAAATTSLPETIGEVRNWDYRFCWIRDASMVVKVVSELGHKNVARRYLNFIVDLIPDKDEKLQIMYGINKEKKLTEATLDHLEGYKGSKPVRIGNAAYKQQQNDIYGILMDVIHAQLVRFKNNIDHGEELWSLTKGIVWIVDKHWQEPDKGIWEFRSEDRHFTFSKVLCWVAIDRAIKIARIFNKQRKIDKWSVLEQQIREDIHENAWNPKVKAFTQSYGSSDMDASVLLMESYGFIHARDEKFISTVKAVEKELSNDGLLYRYKNQDDFGLPSSSFTICTFWFINSLFKIGEEERAQQLFDQLLSYSNHLGLFSEDIDFKTKRLLGNFPQAYSHLALIECAINFSNKDSVERVLESMKN